MKNSNNVYDNHVNSAAAKGHRLKPIHTDRIRNAKENYFLRKYNMITIIDSAVIKIRTSHLELCKAGVYNEGGLFRYSLFPESVHRDADDEV